ncbi:helix-turn-helix transcriptional regulator [Rummeliibacillus suwonensis]|uniref:helix-turn-helix transcriptional regulator n=1 Tax=Rummeliibacillus suwonensis TaxID=1306154 RepID=UPI0028980F71|nr:helix-turn-helix transcriptional regulator [Rummeliibacillus suwonensis]
MKPRKWLKQARIEKKMTQLEVAKSSNIKRSYYTMIEQGKRNPSVQVAKDISRTLKIDWTNFFEIKSNESTHKITV